MIEEKLHVIPHDHKITKEDREKLNNHPAFLVWFTGLSGSGKSTLAGAVETELQNRRIHTYLLDGDNVRSGLNSDLTFSSEDRVENIRRIAEVANLFVDAGTVVLSAFISPFIEDRNNVKKLVGEDNFIEVHVDCPIEVCEKRDVKGLYEKARKGEISNFTGISSPFEIPKFPDLRVHTHLQNLEESVESVMRCIDNKLKEKK